MLKQRLGSDSGFALIMVIGIMLLMSAVSVTLIDFVVSETSRSAHAVVRQTAFEAADAGVNAYGSKLVENSSYYSQRVDAAESTRRSTTGVLVSGGSAWSYTLDWTYPNGHDRWVQLPDGYEYNLEISKPDVSGAIGILSVGRKIGDTNTSNWREIQTLLRPASITDYYRIVNGDVAFGNTTTTNGQVYSAGNISHSGTASANLYAEGQVTGNPNLTNGAIAYDSNSNPTIRSVLATPLQFSDFLASTSDIAAAAAPAAGGVTLNDSTAAAWIVVFLNNGTFTAQSCKAHGSSNIAAVLPTGSDCKGAQTFPVPSNGAIYSNQTVIVSGTILGRATVASGNNIVVGGGISYVTPGQDVLGLVATNDVIIATYVPDPFNWTAAVLAETGTWHTYCGGSPSCTGSQMKNTMNFTGSATTADGGDMTMFNNRNYGYDTNLRHLAPPWFPTIQDSYTVEYFREVVPK